MKRLRRSRTVRSQGRLSEKREPMIGLYIHLTEDSFDDLMKDYFSLGAPQAIYDFLYEQSEQNEEPMFIYPGDIRIMFSEYEDAIEACEDIGELEEVKENLEPGEDLNTACEDHLAMNYGSVIHFDAGILVTGLR